MTHANEILTYENQGLRSKMSSADNMPILYLGEEEEFSSRRNQRDDSGRYC